jgi:hypothetical protein
LDRLARGTPIAQGTTSSVGPPVALRRRLLPSYLWMTSSGLQAPRRRPVFIGKAPRRCLECVSRICQRPLCELSRALVYAGWMDIDVAQTASAVMPYVTAVVAAYGKDTVDKVRDLAVANASDATVNLGKRLLGRILRRGDSRESIEEALVDVTNGEEDGEAALRLQIRKALAADADLARDVAAMLPAVHNEASGEHSVATGDNSGIVSTGNGAFNVGVQHNHGSGTFVGRDYNFRPGGE